MVDINKLRSVSELVEAYIGESQAFLDTIGGHEDDPAMLGYAEYGVPWHWAVCQSQGGENNMCVRNA